jgi:3-hydroxyisobutyrate dehydrogenase
MDRGTLKKTHLSLKNPNPTENRNIMASNDRIAIIGTGLMGRPMAERILRAGYPLSVYNRTLEKAAPLKDLGAKVLKSGVDAISESDCVVLMLSDYEAIRDVLFSRDSTRALSGRTFIQMGTISPEESVSLSKLIMKRGGDYLEAPVLGSIPEAVEGKLIVMVGGSSDQFERWLGLLNCFGPDPLLIGRVGQAAALKLAMNQLIAGLTSAFSLSLAFVQCSGVPNKHFMDILRKSALYAPTFDKKRRRMLERDFSDPNFPIKHLAKDIGLFMTAARSLDLETAGIEGIRKIVEKAVFQGQSEEDYSAIHNIIYPNS